jgi:hypothetical protein
VLLFNTARRVPPRVFLRRAPLVPAAATTMNGDALRSAPATFPTPGPDELANLPLAATGRE